MNVEGARGGHILDATQSIRGRGGGKERIIGAQGVYMD